MKQVITKTFLIFAFVQIAALLLGTKFIQQSVSFVQNSASTDNSFILFATIVVFAVILLVVLKYYKGKILFRLLELLMQFTAIQLLLALFFAFPIPEIVAIIGIAIRLKWPETRQYFLIATVIVVGALLGSSLDVLPAAILATLLAIYDVVAVFYTKHMVTLAKNLNQREAAFSLKITGNKEKLELGTGDLVIPAMLIVAANKVGIKILLFSLPAVFGLIGSILGIGILLWFLEKHRGYWPALPPITLGTLLGIGIAMLL